MDEKPMKEHEAKAFDAYVCTQYSGNSWWTGEVVKELYEVSFRVYRES